MTLAVRELHDVSELGREWEYSPLDAQECWMAGLSPDLAVEESIRLSDASFIESVGGRPLCAWGYRSESAIGALGTVWLLGTPLVQRHPLAFCKRSRALRDELHTRFKTLRAFVWDGHQPAKRWLGWLGFDVAEVRGPFLIMQRTR